MKDQIINFVTAKLAKSKGYSQCSLPTVYEKEGGALTTLSGGCYDSGEDSKRYINAPTQSLLQRFIREKRGVHIEVRRRASGYFWEMCRSDGGTNLGWSGHSGPNDGGVWGSFEDALENALQVQLAYDLPKDTSVIKHWSNYVDQAIKKHNR